MTATAPAPGSLAWFEVATDDPERAEKFYGGLFDWSFADDGPVSETMDYRRITAAGSSAPMGGLFATGGRLPGHAVFSIVVTDVAATCAQAEALGGTVVSRHLDVAPGVPTFAYLRDPDGQLFGIFAPRPDRSGPPLSRSSARAARRGRRPGRPAARRARAAWSHS